MLMTKYITKARLNSSWDHCQE